MKDKEKQKFEFKVIDNNTGKEADIGKIALKEDWAKGLMYCDMQGFAILDDGNLVLLDECGKFEYCPSERFSVKFEDSVVLLKEEYEKLKYTWITDSDAYKKGSKETAEKYNDKLVAIIQHLFDIGQIDFKAKIELLKENEKLAKSFGVEIKE